MPSLSLTLLRTQSDGRLVALASEGHERAFEAIVERYRRPLLRAARRLLPEGRAEDALQQSFLSAWTALQRGDEVRDLRAWLYRIVHNCALNAQRVGGYDYEELSDALRMAEAPSEVLERRAVIRQTLASVAALPERQREALLRTAISGDEQAVVARDLGLSENAFRQLLHRARAAVRAAATAVTPLPAVNWLADGAAAGRATVAERIAELTGAAPVGVAATLAKAGTVAVVAGGALTGPAVVDRVADGPSRALRGDASATARLDGPARQAVQSDGTTADGLLRVGAHPQRVLSAARTDRRGSRPSGGARPRGLRRPGKSDGTAGDDRGLPGRVPGADGVHPRPRDERDDPDEREEPDDRDDREGRDGGEEDREAKSGEGDDDEAEERDDDRSGSDFGSSGSPHGSGSSGSSSGPNDDWEAAEDGVEFTWSGSGDDAPDGDEDDDALIP